MTITQVSVELLKLTVLLILASGISMTLTAGILYQPLVTVYKRTCVSPFFVILYVMFGNWFAALLLLVTGALTLYALFCEPDTKSKVFGEVEHWQVLTLFGVFAGCTVVVLSIVVKVDIYTAYHPGMLIPYLFH
jgi:predicted membrane protein